MKRFGFCMALGLITLAGIASACWVDNFSSVHFHSGKPDFGELPRRGMLRWKEADTRHPTNDNVCAEPAYVELKEEKFYRWSDARIANRERLIKRIFNSVNKRQWKSAQQQIQSVAQRFEWTGNLRDMAMVLKRIQPLSAKQRSELIPAAKLYFEGMAGLEAKSYPVENVKFKPILTLPKAGFLREHSLYQLASLHAQERYYGEARKQFRQLLKTYPKSPKREETLIMMARSAILPHHKDLRDISTGKAAMTQLVQEFPRSRFLKELPGLRSRLLFLDKQYRAALNLYLQAKLLDSARIVIDELPESERGQANLRLLVAHLRAINSAKTYLPYEYSVLEVDRLREMTDVEQARQFASLLKRDPELAAAYLYYRLYHTRIKPKEFRQLSLFADEIIEQNRNVRLSPLVMTRFSEVAYRGKDYRRAQTWANRSLEVSVTDRALYVRGASRHKLKQNAGATRDFEAILQRFPKSPLVPNAHENLALLYEATGRFDKALDCYFALQLHSPYYEATHENPGERSSFAYQGDIAYMLDVRMTTAQVAAYLRNHPRHSEHSLIVYSLGIRYLRDEKWNEAERQFLSLPDTIYDEYNEERILTEHTLAYYLEKTSSPDPLQAVRELRRRHRKVRFATTPNLRAKAMYEYASYYSTHGNLLLYNGALWKQGRVYHFDFWWNETVASKQDVLAVRRYMYQHEAFARSRDLCKQIARQYPKAPILPYVLYRQAAATRRLAHFNQWWNKETDRAKLSEESIRTMRRIARNYPRHPIAVHARKYAGVFEQERKELVWERKRMRGEGAVIAEAKR